MSPNYSSDLNATDVKFFQFDPELVARNVLRRIRITPIFSSLRMRVCLYVIVSIFLSIFLSIFVMNRVAGIESAFKSYALITPQPLTSLRGFLSFFPVIPCILVALLIKNYFDGLAYEALSRVNFWISDSLGKKDRPSMDDIFEQAAMFFSSSALDPNAKFGPLFLEVSNRIRKGDYATFELAELIKYYRGNAMLVLEQGSMTGEIAESYAQVAEGFLTLSCQKMNFILTWFTVLNIVLIACSVYVFIILV